MTQSGSSAGSTTGNAARAIMLSLRDGARWNGGTRGLKERSLDPTHMTVASGTQPEILQGVLNQNSDGFYNRMSVVPVTATVRTLGES